MSDIAHFAFTPLEVREIDFIYSLFVYILSGCVRTAIVFRGLTFLVKCYKLIVNH